MRILPGLCVLVAALWSPLAHAMDGGRLGEVSVVEPVGPPRGLVVLFSASSGWGTEEERAARLLSQDGVLVVRVDTRRFVETIAGDTEDCHWASGDAEQVSRRLQRERGWPDYLPPIMAGMGTGGTLARLALAEAPPNTFAGAVSIDPAATLFSRKPFCLSQPAKPVAGGFTYGVSPLPGFWQVGITSDFADADRRALAALWHGGEVFGLTKLSGYPDRARHLAALVADNVAEGAARGGDVPVVEMPAGASSPFLAVILSGDGGWRDIDTSIATYFHGKGINVVGFDSLKYFWTRKPPDTVAADIGAVIERYRTRWKTGKVALIGYSFGADVLPFVYTRLPEQTKARVAELALLGLAHHTDFEIHVQGWMGKDVGADAASVVAELDKVPAARVQCFYGEEDATSACHGLDAKGVEVVATPGGHHFGGDYDRIAQRILDGVQTRLGP